MKTKLLLLLSLVTFSLYAQFTDDFESYNLGSMANQNINLWNTWNGNYEANLSIIVDDTQSLSGTKSGYVSMDNGMETDAFLLLGNKPSGLWTLKFKMFVPSNKTGYFNIQGETSPSGGVGNGTNTFISNGVYFNQNNSNPGVGVESNSGNNFNFPHDTWFEILVFFDIDNLTYQLSVNNTLVNTTPENFGGNQTILGAIDFFAGTDTSFWIDDIQFVSGTLSIGNNLVNNKVKLFPNPTSGLININNKENLIIKNITIFNTLGQIVKKTNNTENIDLTSLNNGIYYISILFNNNDKSIFKIVKE